MSRRRKHRGISLGTIVMLILMAAVTLGILYVLPRLAGDAKIDIDPNQVLEAFNFSDTLPELSLSDIPIGTTVPESLSTPAITEASQALQTAAPATVAPTAQVGGSFAMTLTGSVCIESAVRKSAYYSESKKYDFTEILSQIAPRMRSDLTVVPLDNLIIPGAKVSDTVAPEAVAPMLASAGANVVALGFTEAYDQGMAGLQSTIEAITAKKMAAIGAFSSAADASSVQIMTLGGVRVALLHYTDGLTNKGKKAIAKDGNAFALPQAESEAILRDMESARASGAQVVIVSLHWGSTSRTAPTKAQTALAQQLADGGADVIVGTGSQNVQRVKWLIGRRADGSQKRTLCAYSLGSILCESRKNANVAGMLLHLRIACDANGDVTFEEASYTPTYIWRYKQDGMYAYRVVDSHQAAPDGMSDDQRKSMERALSTTRKALADAPLTLRAP